MALGRTYYSRPEDQRSTLAPPPRDRDRAARVAESLVKLLSCSISHHIAQLALERISNTGHGPRTHTATVQRDVERANLPQSGADLALKVRSLLDATFAGLVLGDDHVALGLEPHELEALKAALGYDT